MFIRLVSDVHLEFGNTDVFIPPMAADRETVLVVAGDLHQGNKGADWLNDATDFFRYVVYVIGNHELYNANLDTIISDLRPRLNSKVHLLHRAGVVIDDVMFLGCPLWTDFSKGNTMSMLRAAQYMNDYEYCRTNEGKLTTSRIYREHARDLDWLSDTLQVLAEPDENMNPVRKTVVVTHHAPSYRSVHPQFRNDKLNDCYVSDLEYLFHRFKIDYWFHGHSHRTVPYEINGCKVRQNPYGYYNHEVNPDFDCYFRVEV